MPTKSSRDVDSESQPDAATEELLKANHPGELSFYPRALRLIIVVAASYFRLFLINPADTCASE